MKNALLGLALVVAGTIISMTGVAPAAATTPPASTTPTIVPPVFTDAPAVRDEFLSIALANLAEQSRPQFNGFFDAWVVAYPSLQGGGSNIDIVGTSRVSTLHNLLNSKNPAGEANPTIIAFAVSDTSGRCAGAVIYGFPKTDRVEKIDSPAVCNAQGVVAAFRLIFSATPPPVTTVPGEATIAPATVLPLPPNTGSGTDPVGSQETGVLVLAMLVMGAGMALATRVRSRD